MPISRTVVRKNSAEEFLLRNNELCPYRVMVSHKTGTLGLSGRPGSIPGVGVNCINLLYFFFVNVLWFLREFRSIYLRLKRQPA